MDENEEDSIYQLDNAPPMDPVADSAEESPQGTAEGDEFPVEDDGEPEAQAAEGDDSESAGDEADDPLVTLTDGTQVKFSELTNGYLRQGDYTRKTQEVAAQRKALQDVRSQYDQTLQEAAHFRQSMANYLTGLVPKEPDMTLMNSNPTEWFRQNAMRQKAQETVQAFLERTQADYQKLAQVAETDMQAQRAQEVTAIQAKLPTAAADVDRFLDGVQETALSFGFEKEHIEGITDARIWELVHYAAIGRKATQAQAAGKPRTAAPQKARNSRGQFVGNDGQSKARERFQRSGSMEDAMRLDINL